MLASNEPLRCDLCDFAEHIADTKNVLQFGLHREQLRSHSDIIWSAVKAARPPLSRLIFLDFSKVHNLMDRGWLERCMLALGFGPRVCQWATLLHAGLSASVQYDSWLSLLFPVISGKAQDSPLSLLLYVLALSPLAAAVRQHDRLGQGRNLLYIYIYIHFVEVFFSGI